MTPTRCLILGAGGHARVLIDALQASGMATPVALLDADRSLWGTTLLGVPVVGGDDRLSTLTKDGITHFLVGLGSVGDCRPRRRLYELGLAHGLRPLRALVHPSAVCSRWATVGEGTVVYPASVINAGAVIGVNGIINTGAIVEHDCTIGDHAHVATGATLCGGVQVGAGAHIGAGATVRQGLMIGDEAIVGAGAVVVSHVAAGLVVAGVPARRVLRRERRLTTNPLSAMARATS